ncbi:MAG: FG-GAP repeat domain-containing protein [Planctomycetota bacterium]|jgi:hypothetical protein
MKPLAALLMLAAAALAQHGVTELACPSGIQYRIARDIDGDGFDDLLLVTAREVWVYRGTATGMRRQPDRKNALPRGTALFHIGLRGGPRPQFLFRTAAAYFAGENRVGPAGPGLPPRVGNVLWRLLFTDLDGDTTPDIVDVSLQGYRILFGDKTETLLPPELSEVAETAVDSESDRLLARLAFAAWHGGNFDGDKNRDFAVMREKGLLVYTGDDKGKFDAERSFELELDEAKDAELTLRDFNEDGQTDLLAVDRKKGRATLLVADPAEGLRKPKRVRLTVPGRMRLTIVSDLDGDGRPDLALPFLPKISIQDVVRVVARREVVLRVPLFLNHGGDRVFAVRADANFSLPVRVRVRTDNVGRLRLGGLVVVEYGGDLDGDGRKDLVVTETPTRLAVRRGVPKGVFADRTDRWIDIPDCSAFDEIRSLAANLNGDASSDIILHYKGAGRRPDRLFALISRKK